MRPSRSRARSVAVAALCCALLPVSAAASEPGAAGPPDAAEAATASHASDADWASVDRELDEVAALVEAAQFRTALGLAEATRALVDARDSDGRDASAAPRRARLELLVATAELALGQRTRARQSMGRALRADPGLALDERDTSPKVVELWREARAAVAGAPARVAEPTP